MFTETLISWPSFIAVTVVLGGSAAYMAGRAVALTWKPIWHGLFYTMALGCASRFFHYALFDGQLLSPHAYALDVLIFIVLAALGFWLTRVKQMTSQYRWLYRRSAIFFWRRITAKEV